MMGVYDAIKVEIYLSNEEEYIIKVYLSNGKKVVAITDNIWKEE